MKVVGARITADQIEQYQRNGTVRVPGAFNDWVDSLAAAVVDDPTIILRCAMVSRRRMRRCR